MPSPSTGVLLVNLGTPQSPSTKDVRKYLREFLLDPRVIDIPWWKRQWLVRFIIAPFRAPKSAKVYQDIWTEEGSPLLVYGRQLQQKLREQLPDDYTVALGMRYQQPSIPNALHKLKETPVNRLIVLPLFPQYASATTGSVQQKVMETVGQWQVIPDMQFISRFYNHPGVIQAFVERGQQYELDRYEHFVFSFHGLPERQIKKASVNNYCRLGSCCRRMRKRNYYCYRAQSFDTARKIAHELKIDESDYRVTFQSRLGSDPWLKPYTSDYIKQLGKDGYRNVLVFSPSFVCDCIETTHEIGVENAEYFEEAGGEHLQLVEGLNTHSTFVEALTDLVTSRPQ